MHCSVSRAFWVILRRAESTSLLDEAILGLELLGEDVEMQDDSIQSVDLVLERVMIPALADVLFVLTVKDDKSAVAAFPALRESLLWQDACSRAHRGSGYLRQLEWFSWNV